MICINGARSSQEINPSGNTFHYWQYEGAQTFTITISRNGKKIILPGPLHTNKKDCTLNSLWDFVSVYCQSGIWTSASTHYIIKCTTLKFHFATLNSIILIKETVHTFTESKLKMSKFHSKIKKPLFIKYFYLKLLDSITKFNYMISFRPATLHDEKMKDIQLIIYNL